MVKSSAVQTTHVLEKEDKVNATISNDKFKRNEDGSFDLSAAPPFTLQDLRNAIPAHCWQKDMGRSISHLVIDVAIVFAMAFIAYNVNSWMLWPLYWIAQGTMFWAIFVVGHDCGHRSFCNNNTINDFLGHLLHSAILVPYHGWRISHRSHHANHGHVENDESWYPISKNLYDKLEPLTRMGRLSFPLSLLAFPFYLMRRSPGKSGSHFNPSCDLFTPGERNMVITTNACLIAMLAVLTGLTMKFGFGMMVNLYWIPYVINVIWLDVVTYLHHHGPQDGRIKMPWYRGKEWSYLRGGLSSLDRDYGIFNKIHHDIGTHLVHHLFPQIPHYHLTEATEAIKPVLGPYYREPEKCKGLFPFHLISPLFRSLSKDHYVDDSGDVVFYKTDPEFSIFK
eukprot:CAMPEP_0175059828 /NCGR_PEP_ID=MMETSP0052_2-20121109/12650_1 /TAXON_ID=51329 ORGANISM="Polytomella parva, Strain SAG 63-3" /NCGR_SAMPLE_ID=MMETSP0052_2 /ASSEMBLY_ACC=CAM_ASM_000194 /LENGTH=393 /DNA_ID=CAMNT_0016325423 /DNA_START=139 /DNA_END=1320 /DNA_ORIENTATION=-